MPISLAHILEPNKRYGSGVFRRRILLRKRPERVLCELEDYCHGFRVIVHHDGSAITDIDATTIRAPVDICFGARSVIKALVGQPLTSSRQSLAEVSHPTQNCTHIYDLTVLALAHVGRSAEQRQYDIEVDDEKDGILDARAYLDHALVHRWLVRDDEIETPDVLAGVSVVKRTGRWIAANFDGDHAEAAAMLIRGLLVAGARRWDLSTQDGVSSAEFGPGTGVCYTYSEERVHNGRRVSNSIRDFSDSPDDLLKFR
jgi:hypothetical protein